MLRELGRIFLGGVVKRWRRLKNPSARKYPGVRFDVGSGAYGDCRFREGVSVGPYTELSDCDVGRYTYFAAHSQITNCRIGSFCSIGPDVTVGLGRHPARDYVSTYPSFYSPRSAGRADFGVTTDFVEHLSVTIGNDVLISAHCLILDGVAIGDGAIIGAGAVVAKDIPDYAVAGGVPAKVIRQRFKAEQIEFLKRLKWWNKDFDWIRSYASFFCDINLLREAVAKEEAASDSGKDPEPNA
jgi:acetyltransferase-like isoleucine patch superfamily enzyme